MGLGKPVKASRSSAASVRHIDTSGNWPWSIEVTSASWERTWAASGWAKMVRTAAATISAEALGTRAKMFLMKWTRRAATQHR